MKYLFVPVLLLSSYASALDFEGTTYVPVEIKAEASTGLDAIYVVADTHGVTHGIYSRIGKFDRKMVALLAHGGGIQRGAQPQARGKQVVDCLRCRRYGICNRGKRSQSVLLDNKLCRASTQLAFGEHTTRAGLRPHAFGDSAARRPNSMRIHPWAVIYQ